MPVRSRAERFVLPTWEKLMDAVERTEQGRVLIGDLNAELASAIARRPNSEELLADRLLQHLCGEEFFVEGGPDLPTYSHVLDCGRVESQIDHVLCDEGVASALGEGQVLPGLSDGG